MNRRRKNQLLLTLAALMLVCGAVAWNAYPDINSLKRVAEAGDERKTKLYLFLGVDPDQPSKYGYRRHASGYTPLGVASFMGRTEIVKILINHGVDIDLRGGSDRFPHSTPLAWAAMAGKRNVCRLLLEAGAATNIPCSPHIPGDPGGWTALDFALQAEHPDIAQLLKKYGAIEGNRGAGGQPNGAQEPLAWRILNSTFQTTVR